MKRYKIVFAIFSALLVALPQYVSAETKLSDSVTLGGVLEVEAGIVNDDAAGDGSDIVLATVEVGLDAEISDKISGHILLLWEEDDAEEFTVDEGMITVTAPYGLTLTAGRMYVPFGVFNSHFISDPFTLELGETGESGLLAAYGTEQFEVSLGIFNGSVLETGDDDNIDDIVASVTANPAEGISLGASYISDIADSDADITGASAGAGAISKIVSGLSAFISGSFGPFAVEAEYLGAGEEFDAADVGGSLSGNDPSAYNLELAYTLSEDAEVAARYEASNDLELPETRYGLAYSNGIFEGGTIACEYLTGEYENGQGVDSLTIQLAMEF